MSNHICGCHYTTGSESWRLTRHYLPQVQLQSHTTINPLCFTTQLTQTFHNPNTEALPQVRYTFPLYDGVAVNRYTISYAGKTLKGLVKQKDVAKQTYQAAVDRGETGGLLEALPAGVFGVTLGNVPAQADVVVAITYCGELKHDAAIDGLRYMLPTSIAPRFGEYPGQLLKSNAVAQGGISITVDLDMAGSAIRRVQSPSHPIAVSMGALSTAAAAADGPATDAPFMASQASATLTLGTTELAAHFILQLTIDDITTPRALLETYPTLPNHRAIMATLVPHFTLAPIHPEIVFIADQSGSMGGSKNAALVSALKVFIKSLPVGVRFNICAFGNRHKFLWPKSQAYNEANVQAAIAFIDTFTAGYGGTEILKPITAAFENRLGDLPLEVMLLTDGEIWEEKAMFAYVNAQIRGEGKGKKVDARVFALGIGSDVSHTLVEGVARAGNGFAQFVTENEGTERKVVRMLKGALYAHTEGYELEVHYASADGEGKGEEMSDAEQEEDFEIVEKVNECLKITAADDDAKTASQPAAAQAAVKSFFDTDAKVDGPRADAMGTSAGRYAHLPAIATPKLLQAPASIPPLFPFNRTTVYLLLGPESAQQAVTAVTLRATSSEGPLELTIPVLHATTHGGPATIHQLAARKAIQDLEEGRGWLQAATTTSTSTTDGVAGSEEVVVEVKQKYASRFDELVEREAVRLGETFQVAGKWTSFVAVEEAAAHGREQQQHEGAEVEQASSRVREHCRGSAFAVQSGAPFSQSLCSTGGGVSSSMQASPMPNRRLASSQAAGAFRSSRSGVGDAGGGGGAAPSLSGGATQRSAAAPSGLFGSSSSIGGGGPAAAAAAATAGGAFFGNAMLQMQQQGSAFAMSGVGSQPLLAGSTSTPPTDYQGQLMALEQQNKKQLLMSRLGDRASAPGSAAQMRKAEAEAEADEDEDMGFGGLLDDEVRAPPPPPPPPARSSRTRGRELLARRLAARAAQGSNASTASPAADADADADADAHAPSSFDHVTVMHQLIALQTFSGAWPWSRALTEALKITSQQVQLPGCGGHGSDEAVATALAIAYLETRVAAQKDVWEMVVVKARAWLAQQIGVDEKGLERVLLEAVAYV
ncbi:hypothetical protein LTR36_004688 [Oleoguttula mirabilis]|uniref:Uncharacterized protein n=1 Tax=Oleoguttula mirabilis TaxID=1507867 RepID=A0AAV9JFC9_9PEZI|nr:hypothetical protein LTR36_004688 [Oleoguttula mirabilis]